MVLETKPSSPLAMSFPPSGGKPHKVKTGESWGSYAAAAGIPTWGLIEFNFPAVRDTKDFQKKCREVNWLLRTHVGCTKSSDGKNYSFDSGDKPGTIYIPATPERGEDLALRREVAFALAAAPLARLFVHHGGHTITGGTLAAVANRVLEGDIDVVVDSNIAAGGAEYDSGTNTFHLSFRRASSRSQKALIVHEAVHAALDMKAASGMTIAQSESLAYVVQAYYHYSYKRDPRKRLEAPGKPDPNASEVDCTKDDRWRDWCLKDAVYELAWDMARKLAKHEQPSSLEWDALDAAVHHHPAYARKAGRKAHFDGI